MEMDLITQLNVQKRKVDFNSYDISVKELISMVGEGIIDIAPEYQRQFLLKPLKITTLSDKSDLEVRFDLFERLNTGGIMLSNQEIRSCVFRGKFNDFLKTLAIDEDFKKVVKLTSTEEADGTREEYVLRFFAFLNNYQDFDHSVVEFLNKYMAA